MVILPLQKGSDRLVLILEHYPLQSALILA